jgi:ABC-2 type transport system permease protein
MAMQAHAQTGKLFRFSIRKEWVKILLWLIGGVAFIAVGVFAFVEVYGDPVEREAMAFAMENPAMEALFGRAIGLDNYTIGAMYSHMMTVMLLCYFALMSILLVVRNTRAEEEEGILEMLRALPTGRVAHTTSAILLLVVTNLFVAVSTVLLIVPFGDESMTVEGALLTGTIYGTIGLFFGAITLVTAQLSNNARGAMMGAFGVLGLSYILRTIGDSGTEFFSWISPLGLLYGTEPFVNNYWWPVIVANVIVGLLIVFALYLGQRRDIGAGLLPDRAGKRDANSFLKTLLGFNWKLIRTSFFVWLVAVMLLGISYGSVIGDLDGLLEGNEIIEQMIVSDSEYSMVDQFVSTIIGVLSILASIPAIQFFLRLKGEEKKGRSEVMLAGTRSRGSIIRMFCQVACASALVLHVAQMGAFIGAAVAMDSNVDTAQIWQTGLAYLPAIWVMIGLATLLYGWVPKATGWIWAYLIFAFIIHYFAGLFDIPEWIMGISVFHHIPSIPMDEWSWGIFLGLTILAKVLALIGFEGYKRRDISG